MQTHDTPRRGGGQRPPRRRPATASVPPSDRPTGRPQRRRPRGDDAPPPSDSATRPNDRGAGPDGVAGPPWTPRAILWQLALNARNHYERWLYRIRDRRLPTHLAREPQPRKKWDGSFETPEEAQDRWVWTRLVRECLRRRVDPYDRIKAAHAACGDADDPPPPEALLRLPDDLVERLTRDKAGRLASDHRGFISTVRTQISWHSGPGRVNAERQGVWWALEHTIGVSHASLFVHLVARLYGLDELAERSAGPALLQYVFARDGYDELYGASVPEDLRRPADAFYEFLDAPGPGGGGPWA
jgi:hypothetical protein